MIVHKLGWKKIGRNHSPSAFTPHILACCLLLQHSLVINRHGIKIPLLVFLIGIAVVSVYLYLVVDMLPYPASAITTSIALADGPIIAVATQGLNRLPDTFIESALVDMVATWLFLIYLTDHDKKLPGVGFVAVFVLVLLIFAWPWLHEQSWWVLLSMVFATGQSVLTNNKLSRPASEADNPFPSELFIVGLLFIWIMAMSLGSYFQVQS